MASSFESDSSRAFEPLYRTQVDATGDDGISVSIVEAIATVNGVDPTDVDFRLADWLDVDALDNLYEHANTESEIEWVVDFTVDECHVTVRSDGQIAIS